MPNAKLPERPSLEYLRKLAKTRLQELRRAEPEAQLADAFLQIAREYGFPSWRALKAASTDTGQRRSPARRCGFCRLPTPAEAWPSTETYSDSR